MTVKAIMDYAPQHGGNITGNFIGALYEIQRQNEKAGDDGYTPYMNMQAPHKIVVVPNGYWDGGIIAEAWEVHSASDSFICRFRDPHEAEYAAIVCDMLAPSEKPKDRYAWRVDLSLVYDAPPGDDQAALVPVYDALLSNPAVKGLCVYVHDDVPYRVRFKPGLVDASGTVDYSYLERPGHFVTVMDGEDEA